MPRILLVTALAATLATACDAPPDAPEPAEDRAAVADAATSQAKRITIDAEGLDRARIDEIAQHVESLGDVAEARVQARRDARGVGVVSIEIAGADLPSDDELTEEIRGLPGMAAASVLVESVRREDFGAGPVALPADRSKSPEAVKADVIRQLKADGVDGEVSVDVHDEDGERRVEVRVQKHEDDAPVTDLQAR